MYECIWSSVQVSYIIEEYWCHRTPNPDVLCNKRIKFGMYHLNLKGSTKSNDLFLLFQIMSVLTVQVCSWMPSALWNLITLLLGIMPMLSTHLRIIRISLLYRIIKRQVAYSGYTFVLSYFSPVLVTWLFPFGMFF